MKLDGWCDRDASSGRPGAPPTDSGRADGACGREPAQGATIAIRDKARGFLIQEGGSLAHLLGIGGAGHDEAPHREEFRAGGQLSAHAIEA